MRPALHRELTLSGRTLVILDEVHHGGDALSWGDAIREAFGSAEKRLSLTGTPFRSDTAPIPFVEYEPDAQGVRLSKTDYAYGYGRALADGVVRPVIFMVYAGHMRWRTKAGDEMEARLGEDNTKDITSSAWRTALEPTGEWIPAVLRAADRRLTEVRHGIPDAGGLVIATDQSMARAYAKILEEICGEPVTVVLSDEKEASSRIEEFSANTRRWMVAVRMVSEGVDVPRLAVGVYATSSSTPLFFAQAIGRFVRARRRGETASVFLPNVPVLMALGSQLELERDHALDRRGGDADDDGLDDSLLESANREERASEELELGTWEAIGSDASFDRVLYDGTEFGTLAEPGSDEEYDFIGIPGLLEPEQVSELLRHRQARQARRAGDRRKHTAEADAPEPVALYRTLKEQRSLLNSLVGLWAQAHRRGALAGARRAAARVRRPRGRAGDGDPAAVAHRVAAAAPRQQVSRRAGGRVGADLVCCFSTACRNRRRIWPITRSRLRRGRLPDRLREPVRRHRRGPRRRRHARGGRGLDRGLLAHGRRPDQAREGPLRPAGERRDLDLVARHREGGRRRGLHHLPTDTGRQHPGHARHPGPVRLRARAPGRRPPSGPPVLAVGPPWTRSPNGSSPPSSTRAGRSLRTCTRAGRRRRRRRAVQPVRRHRARRLRCPDRARHRGHRLHSERVHPAVPRAAGLRPSRPRAARRAARRELGPRAPDARRRRATAERRAAALAGRGRRWRRRRGAASWT